MKLGGNELGCEGSDAICAMMSNVSRCAAASFGMGNVGEVGEVAGLEDAEPVRDACGGNEGVREPLLIEYIVRSGISYVPG